jgi:hypothetical protein
MKRLIFIQLFVFYAHLSWAKAPLLHQLSLHAENLTSENCKSLSLDLNQKLTNVKALDLKGIFNDLGPREFSQKLWHSKQALHQRIKQLHQEMNYSADCARSLRPIFRHIRLLEDLSEEYQARNNLGLAVSSSAFSMKNPQVHKAPGFETIELSQDLESGDLLLTRGNAFTSAAIASLGEEDTQFSHLSLVYKDEKNKIWTIEAHIEVGSIVRPLEAHIKDSNFRTMVLRFEDKKLAARAANFAFETVKKASETTGNINYDFGFDMDEDQNLFCSEIVSWSFSKVSDNQIQVPLIKNRVLMRKSSFVNDLEINIQESFIPADLEIDPRFKIIAEWRDANRVNDSHEKDAILQAMYRWVDDFGYRMINGSSRKSKFYKHIVWYMRRIPLLKNYVKEKLPLNMSRKLIGFFGVLDSVGEWLQIRLQPANKQTIEARGIPLLPEEKYQFLNDLRLADLKLKKQRLHKMFRP